MVRIPIGNSKSARVEVRSVAPDANPYMVLLSVFKTGIEGAIMSHDNLRQAERYLPDNIYDALDHFTKAEWTDKLFGADIKALVVHISPEIRYTRWGSSQRAVRTGPSPVSCSSVWTRSSGTSATSS